MQFQAIPVNLKKLDFIVIMLFLESLIFLYIYSNKIVSIISIIFIFQTSVETPLRVKVIDLDTSVICN